MTSCPRAGMAAGIALLTQYRSIRMKFFTRFLAALSAAILLASCGGGGDDGGALTPARASLSAVATPSSIAPLGTSTIEVTARKGDGSAVVDGTTINILLSPANGASAPVSASTVGGRASFGVTASATTGTVRVTVSMADPGIANSTVTATVDVTVAGAVPTGRMTAVATPTTITQGAISDIVITFTRPDGTNVADGTTISALASPASIGTIGASAQTVGGRANFQFRSATQNGTATIQFSGSDGVSPAAVTATVTITVNGPAPTGTLVATIAPNSITHNASAVVTATLRRANGSVVADGTTINAVLSPSTIGAIRGSGDFGTTASNATTGSQAGFEFRSGTIDGTAQIVVSAVDPEDSTRTLTATVTVTVNGRGPSGRLTATVSPSTVTQSSHAVVTATLRRANGDAVADGVQINAALSPSTLGAISGSGGFGATASNTTTASQSGFVFRAGTVDGTAQVLVSTVDPEDSTRTLTATVTVTVRGAAPAGTLTATANPTTITRNAQSSIIATLRRANGTTIADGAMINAVLLPSTIGRIAGNGTAGATASNTTIGGRANFQFFSGNSEGTAQIVLSAVDPENTALTVTTLVTITVSGQGASRIVVTPLLSTMTQNATNDVAVVVVNRNGEPVADGSTVNLIVTPASLGNVAPATGGSGSNQATSTTVGGRANFRFSSSSTDGEVTLTASSADPDNAGGTISHSATVRIAGAGQPRLSAVATTTLLPPNLFGVTPFIGSPYISEIDVTWRRANGQLVPGGSEIAVSVNPVTFGGYSTLDDPSTSDINEFTTIMGQGPVDVVAGHATLFFHSFTLPGSATVTITAVDPDTQETLQTQVVITVAPTAVPLPSSVSAVSQNSAVYVQGAGGRTSATLIARVVDGAGNPVPNPGAGSAAWDNVVFELADASSLGGARLRGIDADGANQTGPRVLTRTIGGQATATFESGTVEGNVTINVTADRADNNVANGIQDPVTGSLTLTVSDGRLYSIVLTSPTPNGLTVNTVPAAGSSGSSTSPNAGPRNVGNNDGTYSLTVSALATDRRGNPVVQGTTLRFGAIDAPLYGFPSLGHGFFYLTGGDGDPVEKGNRFIAPTGQFTTAGGGAGPGDTLLVFGHLVPGNRDLQEARTVASIDSATSLTITSNFNGNEDTGTSVDNGPILPYIIGRATEVNIGGNSGGVAVQATTNEIGVATVTLNYPVSRLGKATYIYAQGDRAGSSTHKVTGTAGIALPGARPAAVTASTTALPGNVTANLVVCLRDANNEALQGYYLRFSFHDLGGGSGWVDNVLGTGITATPTGTDGCLLTQVRTSGLTSEDDDAGVIFSSGDATIVDVSITTSGSAQNVVNVSPSSLDAGGGPVTIRVTDAAGTPLPGLPIQVACTANGDGAGLSSTIPAATDATGTSSAFITPTNFSGYGYSATGTCTYTVAGVSAEVKVNGVDYCTPAGGTPPGVTPPAICEAAEPGGLTLTLRTNTGGAAVVTGAVGSFPGGLSCTLPVGDTTAACSAEFEVGQVVTLGASVSGGGATAADFIGWSGNCIASPGNPLNATVTIGENTTCAAVFRGSSSTSVRVLQANPTSVNHPGQVVTLRLTDGSGLPVPAVQVTGTCTSGAGMSGFILPTNAWGETLATITSSLTVPTTCPGAPNTASCVFTASGSSASATVQVVGPPCP